MFLEDLVQAALEGCGLNKTDPLIVGVSGGADSFSLLYGLHQLGFNLIIAHLDHGLRKESPEEAAYVAQIAKELALPFVHAWIDVGQVAEQAGESLEEAARNVRYGFLMEQARQRHAQAVAVAHHADDQVETILMHFLRGAAMSGLSGMSYRHIIPLYDPNIPVIRPLLGIWRSEIEAYLDQAGISPCVDESNADTTFFRNRLRHVLIPNLETYNPQIRAVLLRMADVLGEEDALLAEFTKAAWGRCCVSETEERVVLQKSEFRQLHIALQRRVLRAAIGLLRPDLRDVGYDAIERGLKFVETPPENKKIDLVARLDLALVKDFLILKTWSADLPRWDMPLLPIEDFTAQLDVGESIPLDAGWTLRAEKLESIPANALNQVRKLDQTETWLDFNQLQMPLTVRGKKPGDTWQPLGMQGHSQKISDFYVNQKIPEHLRLIWPLVFSGGEVAWVVGLRPAEPFKITAKTRRILVLKLSQETKKP